MTPAPKLAWLVPCRKWLDWPARVTDRFCWPYCPVFGLTDSEMGVLGVTVKALFSVSVSLPVVIVTLRAPVAAAGSMLRTAVAAVPEFAISDTTVMPTPKLA